MKKILLALALVLPFALSAQTPSGQMGLWSPSYPGECTQAQHDAYSATGPDGKLYPTWHPAVDSTGCFFGHEHGDDPSTSPLSAHGPVLFGYVKEQATLGPILHRHEGHVEHKIFVGNGLAFAPTSAAQLKAPLPPLTCDVLFMIHMGSHSPDAFTNNTHEIQNRVRCDNGWEFRVMRLAAIGAAGTVTARCPDRVIATGAYVPEDSPTSAPRNPGGSMGHRFIPSSACIERASMDPFEVWKTQNIFVGPDNRIVVRFAFYPSVSNPSRYIGSDGKPRRTFDQCFAQAGGVFVTQNEPCRAFRLTWDGVPMSWNDPRVPFRGDKRGLRTTDFSISNATGPTTFYTNVLGEMGSRTPFAGSLEQYVSLHGYPYQVNGTTNSVGGDYAAPGLRAVN
jgi:hypothetical protein